MNCYNMSIRAGKKSVKKIDILLICCYNNNVINLTFV